MDKNIEEIYDKLSEQYKGYNLPIKNDELGLTPLYVYQLGMTYVRNSLETYFSDKMCISLNYHIHSKFFKKDYENGKEINKEIIEDDGIVFSFDKVIENLYFFPETFRINEDYKDDFSKQEIKFFTKIQSYLLFMGVKDVTLDTDMDERCKNKNIEKYKEYDETDHSNYFIDKLIKGDIDFTVYREWRKYDKDPHVVFVKELVFDEDGHIRLTMDETSIECKLYKEVKDDIDDIYKDKFKDDDKVLVEHYKILEVFDK
jgi:hypothetical protein